VINSKKSSFLQLASKSFQQVKWKDKAAPQAGYHADSHISVGEISIVQAMKVMKNLRYEKICDRQGRTRSTIILD